MLKLMLCVITALSIVSCQTYTQCRVTMKDGSTSTEGRSMTILEGKDKDVVAILKALEGVIASGEVKEIQIIHKTGIPDWSPGKSLQFSGM